MKGDGTGRARRGFPQMLRRRPYALPLLGAALLAGALVGIKLGQSAVAGINPIYFQGAVEPPKGVTPNARPANAPATYLEAYNWEAGQSARASDCGENCGPLPAYRDRAFDDAPMPAPRLAGPNWREATAPAELEPWPAGDVRVHRGGVTRYADYPIEEKPADADKPSDDYGDDEFYDE